MTAALEALHRQYPNQFKTDVICCCPDIYRHNPWVKKLNGQGHKLVMEYPSVHRSNQTAVLYINGYVEFLGDYLGIPLIPQTNRPHLYFTGEELTRPRPMEQKYAVLCSGYKLWNTTKNWGFDNWQKVADSLRAKGLTVVQVGQHKPPLHVHRALDGVVNLIGKTTARELFLLAYHSEIGLGHESFLHHIYGALRKPFVCVASGWNPKGWASYDTEEYVTRQGTLPCCRHGGCWKDHVTLQPNDPKSLCVLPDKVGDEDVGRCMALIEPHEVIEAVEKFYVGGMLTP